MRWPKHARKWKLKEIEKDARRATDIFRERRLGEPKERYLKAFELLEAANRMRFLQSRGFSHDVIRLAFENGAGKVT